MLVNIIQKSSSSLEGIVNKILENVAKAGQLNGPINRTANYDPSAPTLVCAWPSSSERRNAEFDNMMIILRDEAFSDIQNYGLIILHVHRSEMGEFTEPHISHDLKTNAVNTWFILLKHGDLDIFDTPEMQEHISDIAHFLKRGDQDVITNQPQRLADESPSSEKKPLLDKGSTCSSCSPCCRQSISPA